MEHLRYKNRTIVHVLSTPFVWMMLIPFVLLDVFLFVYQIIVFNLYQLPYIPRFRYIKIDRHKLSYLSLVNKVNCVYCGYSNGLMAYATAIVAQTEFYWCGIKHEQNSEFISPDHHRNFVDYNDKQAFIDKYKR